MSTPTWDAVLNHTVSNSPTTKTYIMDWIRRLVLDLPESVPYMRLYGPLQSGKTTFANAVSMLVPSVTDYWLWTGTWNSHLKNARLAILEGPRIEKSELLDKMAEYQKPTITIDTMLQPPVVIENRIRWIECVRPGSDVIPSWDFIIVQLQPVSNSVPWDVIKKLLKDELEEFCERLTQ